MRVYLATQLYPTLCDPVGYIPQAPLSMGFPRQEYGSGLSCPPPGGSSQPKEDFLHLLELAGGVFTTEPPGKPMETPKQRPSWEGPGVGKGELCSLLQGSRENRGGLGASPWAGTRRQHRGPARVCCLLGSRAGEAHVSERPVYPLEATGQAERPVPPERPLGRREPCAEDKQNSECAHKYLWEHFQIGFPVP